MKISPPTVGPIVGYTTDQHARIFFRGEMERDGSGFRRCFAVIRWRAKGRKWSKPLFNKMSPNFDFTAVLVLQDLSADTAYEYQCGWFFADAELEKIRDLTEKQLEWPDTKGGSTSYGFTTGTANPSAARSFAVGSCRYMLRLFGGHWFDDRGDKVFGSIFKQLEKTRLHGLLMIGDQIYADDLNFLLPDTKTDQFLERYRTVFAQEHVRNLMARLPTYMILDDHEIEDNWPAKATNRDRVTLYPKAIHAYQIYQCSHSPLFGVVDGRIEGTLTRFWYSFSDGCADWFVMDTRTERRLDLHQVISVSQLTALLAWLNDGSNRTKFVISSVPVFPDPDGDASDQWTGFPEQRKQIIDYIRAKRVPKVVFVSGDVHCSFVCELKSDEDPAFKVHSVVSSSFFWPYPHAKLADFRFSVPLAGASSYRCNRISDVHSDDNFARIDVDTTSVTVTYYERKGAQLGRPVVFTP